MFRPFAAISWAVGLGLGWTAIAAQAAPVEVQILQLNDLYEIAPIQGRGGLARVATLKQRLRQQNPNTLSVLAGDFLSPSALGTAKVNGEPLAGRQMVAVLNTMGLDYATFGNHEFDLGVQQLNQRIQESQFRWLSSNVIQADGFMFPRVSRSIVQNFAGAQGGEVRVGIIGITLPANRADYVQYQDAIKAAQEEVRSLKGLYDVLVAVTHQSLAEDRQLAAAVPQIDVIMGGHEHQAIATAEPVTRVGLPAACPRPTTPIIKADANAISTYIHQLRFDPATRCLTLSAHKQMIDGQLPPDPATAAVVKKWQDMAFAGFRAEGFDPDRVVAQTPIPLDGREVSVRNLATALTQAIGRGLLRSSPKAELAIFNGGAIRLDDTLLPGEITEYDIIRTLPFGGRVTTVALEGRVLQRVLDTGITNRGSGGFLHHTNVQRRQGRWWIQGRPLQARRTYRVATSDFLVSGRERNLAFLRLGAPGVRLLQQGEDIRRSLIQQLQVQF